MSRIIYFVTNCITRPELTDEDPKFAISWVVWKVRVLDAVGDAHKVFGMRIGVGCAVPCMGDHDDAQRLACLLSPTLELAHFSDREECLRLRLFEILATWKRKLVCVSAGLLGPGEQPRSSH